MGARHQEEGRCHFEPVQSKRTDPSEQQRQSCFRLHPRPPSARPPSISPHALPLRPPGQGLGHLWLRMPGFKTPSPRLCPSATPQPQFPRRTPVFISSSVQRTHVSELQPSSQESLCASVSRDPCSLFQFPPPWVRGTLRTGLPHVLRTLVLVFDKPYIFCSCFLSHTSDWRRLGATGAWRSSISGAGGRHDVKLAKPLGGKPLRPQPLRRQRFRACARRWGVGALLSYRKARRSLALPTSLPELQI